MTGLIKVLLISLMSALIVQGDVEKIRNLVSEKGLDPRLVVNLEGRIYYIGSIMENYDDAVTLCNDISMVLVSIETQQEKQILENYIWENGLPRSTYATSGTKLYDRWFWSGSGQEFTYTNWGDREPRYPQEPVCVYLHVAVDFSDWHSEGCYAANLVICEQNANYCH